MAPAANLMDLSWEAGAYNSGTDGWDGFRTLVSPAGSQHVSRREERHTGCFLDAQPAVRHVLPGPPSLAEDTASGKRQGLTASSTGMDRQTDGQAPSQGLPSLSTHLLNPCRVCLAL